MQGENVADMIRRLRTERGWSQERLAAKVCRAARVPLDTLKRNDIYRYEKGLRTPREWLPAIAQAFDVPIAEFRAAMEPSPQQPASVADFLPDGDPLAPLKTRQGKRVGMNDVTDLAGRVHGLRLADDVLAGGDLIAPALRELRSAVRLYREGSHTEAIGSALLAQIGELSQIAGWIAADAGQRQEAERIYQLGLSAARQAMDPTLVGNLAGSLAYMWSNNGQAEKAVELVRAGITDNAPAKARALHWDRVAWAHTQAQQGREAIAALGEASEAIAQDDGDNPPYLYWVSPDELTVMESRVYTELHKPLRAVPLLKEILGRYDVTRTRELALYLSWLAVAYADANEPEEAAATATRVITMSADITSDRTAERVKIILARLQEYADVPEVREVLDSVA
ncbi:XRE family transcriptional regulator [Streptomyces sp. AcH 505]|uniref:helix-turn-helix domain-containing protein n=1 Tax=Streptomyces sp. AcH 505 TaxID=352211 RepID=UPI000591EAAB|nr:XRE family transcriptional regulator [Streptomyces sp. AcH 505]